MMIYLGSTAVREAIAVRIGREAGTNRGIEAQPSIYIYIVLYIRSSLVDCSLSLNNVIFFYTQIY